LIVEQFFSYIMTTASYILMRLLCCVVHHGSGNRCKPIQLYLWHQL